jgi:uncharacterized membrane protein
MYNVESFLSDSEEKAVVEAIKLAEKNTSGEIRVHIEEKTKKPTSARAEEVFFSLQMDQTKDRNGVLLYIAVTDKQFAILGDFGIHKLVNNDFWDDVYQLITAYFADNQFEKGLVMGIEKIGEKLKHYFPFQSDDQNELSDEISKG